MDADPDDVALLRNVAAADELSLMLLYDRHAGWLLARMSRRCASSEVVDQALQDTFLALWRGAARYRADGSVPAFLWGIAARRLVDVIRRDSSLARRGQWSQIRIDDALVRSAEDEVLLGIEHGQLAGALAELPPDLRVAIEATVLDGLTTTEAAKLLGIPTGTVKSRCRRARAQLREALS
jgi:RNA polymerase sigma-70 factor (ECF subfamily)